MYFRAITVAMTLFSCVLDGSFEPRNTKQSDVLQQKHAKSPENLALDFGQNGAHMYIRLSKFCQGEKSPRRCIETC